MDVITLQLAKKYTDKAIKEPGGPPGSNIPAGGIIIWSGAANAVPDGWALCDGTNGTPDLRGRFVLGNSDSHAVGETGGSEEVVLTVQQMPKHAHLIGVGGPSDANYGSVAFGASETTNDMTKDQGGSQPHPNMPPYYTLCYIIKL